MKRDIQTPEDVKIFVDSFYDRVKKDELLSPIFQSRIPENWEPHLETMYRFWNAALFNIREYTGNPLMKHMNLPLTQDHFERWIDLFYQTIDSAFEGPTADEAKRRATIMAHTFYNRLPIKKEISPLPKI
jgi:hemoglobin